MARDTWLEGIKILIEGIELPPVIGCKFDGYTPSDKSAESAIVVRNPHTFRFRFYKEYIAAYTIVNELSDKSAICKLVVQAWDTRVTATGTIMLYNDFIENDDLISTVDFFAETEFERE